MTQDEASVSWLLAEIDRLTSRIQHAEVRYQDTGRVQLPTVERLSAIVHLLIAALPLYNAEVEASRPRRGHG